MVSVRTWMSLGLATLAVLGATGIVRRTGPSSTEAVALAAPSHIDAVATAGAPAVRRSLPGPGHDVPLPADAALVDTSHPDRVIGTGTAASCTSAVVVDAVAHGGVITFSCGPAPVTIAMAATAKVVNTSAVVVLDGGGLVTLSGGGQRRILYMNTCDQAQVWTTSHCQDQESPRLTVQRLTFTEGNSTGDLTEGGGGGAVFVRGGQLTVLDSRFASNVCDSTGPDLGGGGLRVLSQFHGRAVIVAGTTFADNTCSNGAAISSIGVSWRIYNSVFVRDQAIGTGANPSRSGAPGGGSGGAIYLDGNTFTLDLAGSTITDSTANEGGGAIFFVSNDRTGVLRITSSLLERNISRGFGTAGFPGIFFLGSGAPIVSGSTIS
ncbi:MAG: hypothetical protein ABIR68_06340 [Ilumatobacteraceae bacterium]